MPPRPSPDFAQIRMKTYLNHKYIIACPLSHCLFQIFRPAAGSVLWAGSVAPPFSTTRYLLCCCNMSFCRSFSFTSRDFTAYANSEFTPAKRRIFVFFFGYVQQVQVFFSLIVGISYYPCSIKFRSKLILGYLT